jgi:hypothetical protein
MPKFAESDHQKANAIEPNGCEGAALLLPQAALPGPSLRGQWASTRAQAMRAQIRLG